MSLAAATYGSAIASSAPYPESDRDGPARFGRGRDRGHGRGAQRDSVSPKWGGDDEGDGRSRVRRLAEMRRAESHSRLTNSLAHTGSFWGSPASVKSGAQESLPEVHHDDEQQHGPGPESPAFRGMGSVGGGRGGIWGSSKSDDMGRTPPSATRGARASPPRPFLSRDNKTGQGSLGGTGKSPTHRQRKAPPQLLRSDSAGAALAEAIASTSLDVPTEADTWQFFKSSRRNLRINTDPHGDGGNVAHGSGGARGTAGINARSGSSKVVALSSTRSAPGDVPTSLPHLSSFYQGDALSPYSQSVTPMNVQAGRGRKGAPARSPTSGDDGSGDDGGAPAAHAEDPESSPSSRHLSAQQAALTNTMSGRTVDLYEVLDEELDASDSDDDGSGVPGSGGGGSAASSSGARGARGNRGARGTRYEDRIGTDTGNTATDVGGAKWDPPPNEPELDSSGKPKSAADIDAERIQQAARARIAARARAGIGFGSGYGGDGADGGGGGTKKRTKKSPFSSTSRPSPFSTSARQTVGMATTTSGSGVDTFPMTLTATGSGSGNGLRRQPTGGLRVDHPLVSVASMSRLGGVDGHGVDSTWGVHRGYGFGSTTRPHIALLATEAEPEFAARRIGSALPREREPNDRADDSVGRNPLSMTLMKGQGSFRWDHGTRHKGFGKEFTMHPREADFGSVPPQRFYQIDITLRNVSVSSARFRVGPAACVHAKNGNSVRIVHTPLPLAAGMSAVLHIELRAKSPGVYEDVLFINLQGFDIAVPVFANIRVQAKPHEWGKHVKEVEGQEPAGPGNRLLVTLALMVIKRRIGAKIRRMRERKMKLMMNKMFDRTGMMDHAAEGAVSLDDLKAAVENERLRREAKALEAKNLAKNAMKLVKGEKQRRRERAQGKGGDGSGAAAGAGKGKGGGKHAGAKDKDKVSSIQVGAQGGRRRSRQDAHGGHGPVAVSGKTQPPGRRAGPSGFAAGAVPTTPKSPNSIEVFFSGDSPKHKPDANAKK